MHLLNTSVTKEEADAIAAGLILAELPCLIAGYRGLLPDVSAVYFILTNAKRRPLYVGQASRLWARLRNHDQLRGVRLWTRWIAWIETSNDAAVRRCIESAMIRRFQPVNNTVGR